MPFKFFYLQKVNFFDQKLETKLCKLFIFTYIYIKVSVFWQNMLTTKVLIDSKNVIKASLCWYFLWNCWRKEFWSFLLEQRKHQVRLEPGLPSVCGNGHSAFNCIFNQGEGAPEFISIVNGLGDNQCVGGNNSKLIRNISQYFVSIHNRFTKIVWKTEFYEAKEKELVCYEEFGVFAGNWRTRTANLKYELGVG